MPHKRRLPARHNQLLEAAHTPQLEILVERRRLGQTDLAVKPGVVGINNATKAENLGIFDYAHLRVPLPHDLQNSGIFTPLKSGAYPESYFLMRRSNDGYISATGMFKAAYPWATVAEEQSERKHHKSISSAGPEEVAGNVWIAPNHALELADEYDMRTWVVALLDPEPIEKGSREKTTGEIATPPKFIVPDSAKLLPQPGLASSTAARSLRSASPAKSTPRKMASPRKRAARAPSAKAEAKADGESAIAKASKTIQEKVTNGNGAPVITGQDDVVRVSVNETVRKENDIETLKTSVTVDMPASNPNLPIPQSAEKIIAKAKEMVEEANKLEKTKAKATKRKASSSLRSESAKEDGEGSMRVAKKVKTGLEETLTNERVKTRALIGLTATIAIGAIIPYFL